MKKIWVLAVICLISLVHGALASELNINGTAVVSINDSTPEINDLVGFTINVSNFNSSANITNASIEFRFNTSGLVFFSAGVDNATDYNATEVNWSDIDVNASDSENIFTTFFAAGNVTNGTTLNGSVFLFNASGFEMSRSDTVVTIINNRPNSNVSTIITPSATDVYTSVPFALNISVSNKNLTLPLTNASVYVVYNSSRVGFLNSSLSPLSTTAGNFTWNFTIGTNSRQDLFVNFTGLDIDLSSYSVDFDVTVVNSTGQTVNFTDVTIDVVDFTHVCFTDYTSGDLFNFSIAVENYDGSIPSIVNGTIANDQSSTTYNASIWNTTVVGNTTYGCLQWYNVNITDTQAGDLNVYSYLDASQNDITGISPDTFPFPREVFTSSSILGGNSTVPRVIYLSPAVTLNISAYNETNDPINFTYEVIDFDTGEVLSSSFGEGEGMETMVLSVNVTVAETKSVYVQVNPDFAPPIKRLINSSDLVAVSNYRFNASVNASFTFEEMTGYVMYENGTIVQNVTNLTVFSTDIWGRNIVSFSALMPQNLCAESTFDVALRCPRDVLRNDTTNTTTGFFNITAPASVYGYNQMWVAFVSVGDNHYYGYIEQPVTIGNPREFNITVYDMYGEDYDATFGNEIEGLENAVLGFNVSTLAKNISFFAEDWANSSRNRTFNDYQVEVITWEGGQEYRWIIIDFESIIETTNPSGAFFFPRNIDFAAARIYTQDYAPVEFDITFNNDSQVKELKQFEPQSIASDGTISESTLEIQLQFYRNSSDCLNISPSESCELLNGDIVNASTFNPLILMTDEPVRMDMSVVGSDVKLLFYGVDLSQGSAPDAVLNDQPLSSGSDEVIWRFGSFAPPAYEYVYVAAPIDSNNYDINEGLNLSFDVLFNEDFTVAWNVSENGTAESGGELPVRYQDFWNATDGLYRTYFNGSGTECTELNASDLSSTHGNLCYLVEDVEYAVFRLLHFSGIGASFEASSIAQSSNSSSSSSSSSSSGGGGGGGGSSGGASGPAEVSVSEDSPVQAVLGKSTKKKIAGLSSSIGDHFVEVSDIDRTAGTVEVIFTSEPQVFTFSTGQTRQVDLDLDGNFDVEATLVRISASGSSATFEFTALTQPDAPAATTSDSVEETEQEAVDTVEETESEVQEESVTEEVAEPQQETESTNPIVIILILAVIAGAGFAVYKFTQKKEE